MDSSYLSIIIFLIITISYYIFPGMGKLPFTLEDLKNNQFASYYNKNLPRLGIYFLLILVSQFVLNSLYLINKCGGSAGSNIGIAVFYTAFPWVFIFGAVVATLIMYPGLKTAFSDVVGYFAVAGKANDILGSLLIDTKIEEAIGKAEDMDNTAKNTMRKSAEAILKLCSNKSILINQMSPENFLSVWEILEPLMKQVPDIQQKQTDLFQLVVLKDNIGEAMWYIYTAILIISIVSFKLASRGCVKTVDQLKASHEEYLKQEELVQTQNELNNSTTMVLTN